jgi:hypothetical protein
MTVRGSLGMAAILAGAALAACGSSGQGTGGGSGDGSNDGTAADVGTDGPPPDAPAGLDAAGDAAPPLDATTPVDASTPVDAASPADATSPTEGGGAPDAGGGDGSGGSDAGGGDGGSGDAGAADASPGAVVFPCSGCTTFPPPGATACAPATLGPPTIAYPLNGILFPPNLGSFEVQFVPPAGATLFEVDFENATTDVRVETQCAAITPVRGGPSSGCGAALTPAEWTAVTAANRGGPPVQVTVRATIDGTCVSTSTAQVAVSFAQDDVTGGIYYSALAFAGGINGKTQATYRYDFGTATGQATPFVTPGASGTCSGCHSVSRDGARLAWGYDDADGDDEFSDQRFGTLDVATRTVLGGSLLSPGSQTFTHDHSKLIASTFKTGMNKSFTVFTGDGVTLLATDAFPMTWMLGTQPDLSTDDSALAFVVPTTSATYGISMQGDHHFFGGSIYAATFDTATNVLATPIPLLITSGAPPNATNYYYPSFSPPGTFLVFNAAPSGDAFFNVNARVQLLHYPPATGAVPIDLPALNVADGLTNSMPRWSPFVGTYQGHKLLWLTFTSTRDYGLRLANEGFVDCYPPESPAYDAPQPLSKAGVTYAACAQPQIWMAAVIVDEDTSLDSTDRSFPAFWVPAQDVTTHNYHAQWVEQVVTQPPADGGACGETGAACGATAPCCTDTVCCAGLCQPTCSM